MKGLLRAILFGGGWSFGLFAIGLLVGLPEAAFKDRESVVIGACSAIASALVFWTATRLPATPSWPIAIVGWIIGFCLPLVVVRVLLAIADQMLR